MLLTCPVTPLAIDAFGQRAGEQGRIVVIAGPAGNFGIRVVAEHAAVKHLTAETRMIGPVIAGAHAPVTAIFRVPAHREFDQLVIARAMNVADPVVARSENVVDRDIEHVDRFPVRSFLLAANVVLSVLSRRREVLS